jgi:hypothetical protein
VRGVCQVRLHHVRIVGPGAGTGLQVGRDVGCCDAEIAGVNNNASRTKLRERGHGARSDLLGCDLRVTVETAKDAFHQILAAR